jgi:hypothetical protein
VFARPEDAQRQLTQHLSSNPSSPLLRPVRELCPAACFWQPTPINRIVVQITASTELTLRMKSHFWKLGVDSREDTLTVRENKGGSSSAGAAGVGTALETKGTAASPDAAVVIKPGVYSKNGGRLKHSKQQQAPQQQPRQQERVSRGPSRKRARVDAPDETSLEVRVRDTFAV